MISINRIIGGYQVAKSFSYFVTIAPVNKPLALSLVKEHLKISEADVSQDTYLNLLIDAVGEFFEKYTSRLLIDRTVKTYRSSFDDSLEIRRSKVNSIVSVKYLKDTVLTTVDASVYVLPDMYDFSKLCLEESAVWPTDVDDIADAVEIIFTAGYGASHTNMPSDIKIALLNHIAFLYANRGDCNATACNKSNLPASTKAIYDIYRIINIGSRTHGLLCNS